MSDSGIELYPEYCTERSFLKRLIDYIMEVIK
jgi:hypothetical protein